MKQVRILVAAALTLLLYECGAPASQAAQSLVWIHFDDSGGYGEIPDSLSAPAGEWVTLPGAELRDSREEDALRFVGWSTQEGASAPEYLPDTSFLPQESLTLYAVYGQGRYQVTYRTGDFTFTEEVMAGEAPQRVPILGAGYLGWEDETGWPVDLTTERIWQNQTYTPYEDIPLNNRDHTKYMDGISDGLFHPDQDMTRAEAAQILYSLLVEKPEGRATYSDVPEGMWYTQAITSLGALGVLDRPEGAAFQPDAVLTRGDFALILWHFLPGEGADLSFTDVPEGHPAYEAIAVAVSHGLVSGYPDGTFRPDEALTRAEAAVIFNHMLGRTPDTAAIAAASETNLRIFPDGPSSHWAYAQIMEATVSHDYTSSGGEVWTRVETETTPLSDGYYRFGSWLYRVRDGVFLRSTTVDGFTFDAAGRYTTGSDTLDAQLHQIVDAYTTDSMSRNEKLQALYNYVRDNFSYLRRNLVSRGETGWEPAYAEEFLELGRGNCYSFSALFCLLARQLGLPAHTVVGGLGASSSPHGWVEINLDGTNYMFDPQLEWRYRYDYGVRGYNLFMMLPSQAPFTYIR